MIKTTEPRDDGALLHPLDHAVLGCLSLLGKLGEERLPTPAPQAMLDPPMLAALGVISLLRLTRGRLPDPASDGDSPREPRPPRRGDWLR